MCFCLRHRQLQTKTFESTQDIKVGAAKIKTSATVNILGEGVQPGIGTRTYIIIDQRDRQFSVDQDYFKRTFKEVII
uniref:Uncharacterized protein n=1 Tax=viral metagenome TaxID=1070528 RepID=A0A6M3KTG9_9ZZZZ